MRIENVVGISLKDGFVVLEIWDCTTENKHRANIFLNDACEVTVINAETVEVNSN